MRIATQENQIETLQTDLKRTQRNYSELETSMNKKITALEKMYSNQVKFGSEDSFANFHLLEGNGMDFSLIKKGPGKKR